MKWILSLGVLGLVLGCQVPEGGAPIKALPDEVTVKPYPELLTRARQQARLATDAFYLNRWSDLEEAATGLEQTAKYMAKAAEVPTRQKDTLPVTAAVLGKEADALRKAAVAKEVDRANTALQQINFKIRDLRLDE